jgi:hypothetical protein
MHLSIFNDILGGFSFILKPQYYETRKDINEGYDTNYLTQ